MRCIDSTNNTHDDLLTKKYGRLQQRVQGLALALHYCTASENSRRQKSSSLERSEFIAHLDVGVGHWHLSPVFAFLAPSSERCDTLVSTTAKHFGVALWLPALMFMWERKTDLAAKCKDHCLRVAHLPAIFK